MIKSTIEEFLSQTFQLPVNYGSGQTMNTRCIQYTITDMNIQTRTDFSQTAFVEVEIDLRTDNGYDAIGYLSAKLAASKVSGKGWSVSLNSMKETIKDMTSGRGTSYPDSFVLSTPIVFEIHIPHDQVKERIKQMEILTNG